MSRPATTDGPVGDVVKERQCPRCDHNEVTVLAKSPVGDEWEMYLCGQCTYSWRSTEPDEQQDPELYHEKFKMTKEKIENLVVVPPLPNRRS